MNIYLAAASADRHVVKHLIKQIEHQGHKVHNWPSNPGYSDPVLYFPEKIAHENREALLASDGVIWLLSHIKSTGAGYEIGVAHQLGLPISVVALGDPITYQSEPQAHHDGFEWHDSIQEALNWIALELAKDER